MSIHSRLPKVSKQMEHLMSSVTDSMIEEREERVKLIVISYTMRLTLTPFLLSPILSDSV